jgi:DNA processing protein
MPILYIRGAIEALNNDAAVACVGSRRIRSPYNALHAAFARQACAQQTAIISGFALGADTIGHTTAWESKGQTVCVMPGGLDRPFPPENKLLWEKLLEYSGAVFISEFAFGTSASALTLRKRNKGIVALARGVLVSQSSDKGGAMNAFRFALEQHKPVATFAADGNPDTSGNDMIAQDKKLQATVFPTNRPAPEDYQQWLRTLSSLI